MKRALIVRVLVFSCLAVSCLIVAAACRKEAPAAPPPAAAAPPGQAATAQPPASNPDSDAKPDAAEGSAEYSPPDVVTTRKWTGDLDGMIERRVVRVLTTYSKTSYFVDRGSQRGLTYEAFRMFEDDLNKRLRNKNVRVHVVFVPVAHDELIPALVEGKGDIVAAQKLVTEWRREQVDFTNPTATNISSIAVTGPGVPPISSVEDLGGREVYLRKSDISAKGLEQFNARLAKAGKPPVRVREAPEVLADEDILEMVNAGLVPATVTRDFLAEFWKQVFPDLVLNTSAPILTGGQTAIMIRKNSPQLMAELNAFIARYPPGSMQRNVLFQKYLKNAKYAKAATSDSEVAKFRQTIEFLKKYSNEYGLDALLMAAQAYQESGLDQAKKSPVGAIGVMQVMPATGKDMKVGDITKLDPNVHAGVKYMRFMMDRYYGGEHMTPLDKGLFTFASYNAGPARINQLRKRAPDRGLDPNQWFNNVEVLASETIGRETVQYVSNIYKYYLAYKLLMEQQQQREKAKMATQ
jgi:membrane-bound lytic murein transglycosylase MltF